MYTIKRKGFTLVELLVVIAVITLLSSVILSIMGEGRIRARDAARLANANQIALAMELYDTDKGTYSVSGAGYQNTGSGFMSKSGLPDYTTSIFSILHEMGYYTANTIIDPIFGIDNYYLGVCTTTRRYDLYLKVEEPKLQESAIDIENGCDGTNAMTLGFNYIHGKGITNDIVSTGGGNTTGGGTSVTIAIGTIGSSATVGIAMTPTQIALSVAPSANVGNGTFSVLGASLVNSVYNGGHSFMRADGKFVIINGTGANSNIYDPINNTIIAGPTLPYSVAQGAFSVKLNDGRFVVVPMNYASTAIYDPTTNVFATGSTGSSDGFRIGAHPDRLNNGYALIPAGNTSYVTYLLDLNSGTLTRGPGMPHNYIGAGGMGFARNDGNVLFMGGGGNTWTYYYNVGTNVISNGPFATAAVSWGGNALQRPDGKFLAITGGTATNIYDPTTNTFSSGPNLTCNAGMGSHAIQRGDNTFLIYCAGNSSATSIYNPSINTMTAGPSAPFNLYVGAHSFQRPDGKYVLIAGGGNTNVRLYDAGWIMTGTYITEDVSMPTLNASSTLVFTQGGAGNAIVSIKTAATQSDLATATYTPISSGGNILPPAGSQWIKIRADLTRSVPTMPNNPDVWTGEDGTVYFRTPTTPTISDITIMN